MVRINSLGRNLWGVYDDKGQLLYWIEKHRPECVVRRYEPSRRDGRGQIVSTFLGPHSFDEAQKMVRKACASRVLT